MAKVCYGERVRSKIGREKVCVGPALCGAVAREVLIFSRNECENMHEKLSAWEACLKTQSPGFFLGTGPWGTLCLTLLQAPRGQDAQHKPRGYSEDDGRRRCCGFGRTRWGHGWTPSTGMGTGWPRQQTGPGLLRTTVWEHFRGSVAQPLEGAGRKYCSCVLKCK